MAPGATWPTANTRRLPFRCLRTSSRRVASPVGMALTATRTAERAGEAAEAAGAQGRFWQMHDLLFENQNALEDEDLLVYANAIGLDVRRFVIELENGVYTPKVRADFLSGVRSGVNGTP